MRRLFASLIVPLCMIAAGGSFASDGVCDIEKHTDRDPQCWDTYDTIQDMGDIGQYLVYEAECREIMDSVIQTDGQRLTPRQSMINISFVTYSSGYAAGISKPVDFIQVEMLTFCRDNPKAKLQDF